VNKLCVSLCFCLLLLSLVFGTTAFSQTVTFNRTTQSNITSRNHIDLNNDGREDFIYFSETSCANGFLVALSNGDDSYAPPACYTLPSGAPLYVAMGDFNGDGNPDLIVTSGSSKFYEYLNRGNGTLRLQATFVTQATVYAAIAADVNHDGRIDLIFNSVNDNNMHVWFGNGDGGFTVGPSTPLAVAGELWIGDFDGDGKADVMSEVNNYASSTEILYGDGAGHFAASPSVGDDALLVPYDVNGDGKMDLIGAPFDFSINGSTYHNTIDVFYGHSNRTFTKKTITLEQCTAGTMPAIADFDGDGINDIAVIEASDCKGSGPETVNILLGNADGTYQPGQAVYSSNNQIVQPYVLRLNRDSKPDLSVAEAASPFSDIFFTNTTPGKFPACAPPNRGIGITLCSPSSTVAPGSPVHFSIGAASQTPGRKVEVWIDGKKMSENLKQSFSHYSFLDASYNVAPGKHSVGIFAAGWDNLLQLYSFPLTVGSSSCPPPASPGLNVCSPLKNATLGKSALAWASGTVTGKILRMEIWVDGQKRYSTFGSNTLKTSLALGSGTHQFGYYIVNTAGAKWEAIVYATVP
jgi:hypothetical protein